MLFCRDAAAAVVVAAKEVLKRIIVVQTTVLAYMVCFIYYTMLLGHEHHKNLAKCPPPHDSMFLLFCYTSSLQLHHCSVLHWLIDLYTNSQISVIRWSSNNFPNLFTDCSQLIAINNNASDIIYWFADYWRHFTLCYGLLNNTIRNYFHAKLRI